MNDQTLSNLEQIHALKNSPVQSDKVKKHLATRIRIAKREIENLRDFADLGDGKPADHCREIAQEIENSLIEMGIRPAVTGIYKPSRDRNLPIWAKRVTT
jgi:hypothetical protein